MKKALLLTVTCMLSLTTLHAQDAWYNSIFGGFDHPNNYQINKMHEFNGKLYVATGVDSGYVYSSGTGQSNTWSKTFAPQNSTSVNEINSTSGTIYIAAYSGLTDSSVVYSSPDAVTWSPFYSTQGSVNFVVPFRGAGINDSIYVIKNRFQGSVIYKSAYSSNDPLNLANSWDTVFDLNQAGFFYTYIKSVVTHTNKLFVGTDGGAKLWSSADGNNWVQNTSVGLGFNNSNNYSFTAMASFNGYLYIGTENYTDGAQIWKSNDETTWTMVAQYPGSYRVTNMTVAAGELWTTLEFNDGSGGKISRSIDGDTFAFSNSNGFGGGAGYDGTGGSIAKFGNNMYYGFRYQNVRSLRTAITSDGGQIWKLCLSIPPTVNLGPDVTVCAGTLHTFDAGAGYSGYTWCDGSANQTMSGDYPQNYFVTVMGANGCEGKDTAALFNTPSPLLSGNFFEIPPLCTGDSMSISVSVSSNLRDTLLPINRILTNPLPTLDYQSVYDTLFVSGIAPDDFVQNTLVSVTIDSLDHSNNYDLVINLISPSGSMITLASYGGGQNYTGTSFSSNGQSIYDGSAPYTGLFAPVDPFYYLNGSTNGAWVLQITDNYPGNSGALKGWSLQFSQPDTMLSCSWTPAIALSAPNSTNTFAFPSASIVYTFTVTNAIGCSKKDSLLITVPDISIDPLSSVVCYGGSVSLAASGGIAYYWSPSTVLIDTTGTNVSSYALNATTTVYVIDTVSGCSVKDSIVVNVNPELLVSCASQSICFGDAATVVANATGGIPVYSYVYSWDGGANSYAGQTLTTSPTTYTTYSINVLDASGCSANNSFDISVDPSTDIDGHVTLSSGADTSGIVVLYTYLPYQIHFDTVAIASLDVNGDYHFAAVNHGDYLIKVFADTTVYQTLTPTYFGDTWAWDLATVLVHGCAGNSIANIVMVEESGTGGGTGILHGQIIEGPGFGGRAEGGPIPGVDVKLGRNPGGIVASGFTDVMGYYTFDAVADGNYTVYVDIPGLGKDSSYTVTLDPTNHQYLNLDYNVDSTTVYIVPNSTVGISNPAIAAENKFNVYPNPLKGNATIEYSISKEFPVSLEVFNVLGRKIKSVVSETQQAGNYNFSLNKQSDNLNAGVYFITLTIDGKTSTQRIVVME